MYLLQPTAGGDAPRHGEGRVERGMWVCPPGEATWRWLQDQHWATKRLAALTHPCLGRDKVGGVPAGVTALVWCCDRHAVSGVRNRVGHEPGKDIHPAHKPALLQCGVCCSVWHCSPQQLRAAWEKGVMASPPASPVFGPWVSGGTLCVLYWLVGGRVGGWVGG